MSITTTGPASTSAGTSSSASQVSDKDWGDFFSQLLPGAAEAVAPSLGIDPRVAGQTVSQVLSVFGIGGAGKAFAPAIDKQQAAAQARQVLAPYVADPAMRVALQKWIQAAVEPVQAQKEGKAYQPSVDLSKSWFDDAISSIGHAVQSVDWGKVAQVGMQAIPYVVAALA